MNMPSMSVGRYLSLSGLKYFIFALGPRATELIGEAGTALRLESTVEELFHAVHAHPTLSEAVGEAALGIHGRSIHI